MEQIKTSIREQRKPADQRDFFMSIYFIFILFHLLYFFNPVMS